MATEIGPVTGSQGWIGLRPSATNLALTLAAPLGATAILFVLDLPDWMRAALLLALLVVASIDVYRVRQRHAGAIGAFQLISSSEPVPIAGAAVDAGKSETRRRLLIRVRHVHTSSDGVPREAEGIVLDRAYVSAYFTSIPYRLDDDPAWRRWFPRHVVIWADAIERESFRQVRVQLKWR